jgi:hypothetical protein
MMDRETIRRLYPLALAEGEGLGTAYEYIAKRTVLTPWLRQGPQPDRLLVAGLPQKYGLSFDFLFLARELGADVLVVDDRAEALEAMEHALLAVPTLRDALASRLRLEQSAALWELSELDGSFDLSLSSEVLQRLEVQERRIYVRRLRELAPAIALFAPNAGNPEHTTRSGLGGIHLLAMRALLGEIAVEQATVGYIDMPPFPPGITRTEAQREQATTGLLERLAMGGLTLFAYSEKLLPTFLRVRLAHIVYGLARSTSG